MQRISSNITLFLKLFLPIGWTVFFFTLTVTLFIIDETILPLLASNYFRIPFALVFILLATIIFNTVFKLKRIEMGPDFYYATNYLKTYRLIYNDIERVSRVKLGPLSWTTFHLKAAGSFGRKISFLQNNQLYQLFASDHPDVAKGLDERLDKA